MKNNESGSHTPKIFFPMTKTTILTLKSVDFGRDNLLALAISLFLFI